MQSLVDAVRNILGSADFFNEVSQTWNYAAMVEYMICAVILLCVICNVFALLRCLFGGAKR